MALTIAALGAFSFSMPWVSTGVLSSRFVNDFREKGRDAEPHRRSGDVVQMFMLACLLGRPLRKWPPQSHRDVADGDSDRGAAPHQRPLSCGSTDRRWTRTRALSHKT